MEDQRDRRHWHLDKTFNVGHVLTTLALAGSLAIYVTTMDKRIAILEAQNTSQTQSVVNVQQAQKEVTKEIRDEIRALRADLMDLVRNRGHKQ